MDTQYNAPQLRAYLCGRIGAMLMRRLEWEQVAALELGEVAPLDLVTTPIARVASAGCVLAVIAVRTSAARVMIEVYRHDPKDALPVNVDRHEVSELFPPDLDFGSIVVLASTEDNANSRGFRDEWVYFSREEPGLGHWLADVPAHAKPYVRKCPDAASSACA